MVEGIGSPDFLCAEEEVRTLLEQATSACLFNGKRVLVLTPDATRTCPLPMTIRSIAAVMGRRAAKLDFMVALGTHTPLAQTDILKLYVIDGNGKISSGTKFFNHQWGRQESFGRIGS